MYPVSQQFISEVKQNTRKYYWSGSITTKNNRIYEFNNEDIVKGSGYITKQCCGSNEIELGTVYAAELGITLFSDIDRYTLDDALIHLYYHLLLDDETIETIPMGVFEVSEANRNIKTLELKAYDYMLRFDKSFSNKVSSGTAYELLALACEECDVELEQTADEINAMPNGKFLLGIYFENDIDSWRDLIYYVAQVIGCFATINREGKLELRKYENISTIDISQKHRFTSSFSDFVTRYTAVSSTNNKTKESEYYALEVDDALTMNLGVNPLLQFGLQETRKTIITNILNDVSSIHYVPFDSTTIGNPALDLGDIITFSGGHADETQISCITSIQYKIGGKHTLHCVGKNPRLAEAKSKNDKNISGLINSIEAGRIAVHTYMNASAYTLSETNAEIISIEFASNEDTDAQFQASILMDVAAEQVNKSGTAKGTITIPTSDDKTIEQEETFALSWVDDGKAIVTVTYIINDNELTTYYPIETLQSGKHILNLYYPLNGLEGNSYNTFRVWMKINSGSASVARGQCIATISGQGLSANNAWDGRLELSDVFTTFSNVGAMDVSKVKDYLNLLQQEVPAPIGITQGFSLVSLESSMITAFSETVAVNPVIVTESIDVSDREEMNFNTYYVKTEDVFELQLEYTFKSKEYPIDEGQETRLEIVTEEFVRLDSLEVSKLG